MQPIHCKFYRKMTESRLFPSSLLIFFCLTLLACSTKFNVNAPYKEENSIIGLLELHNTYQIIKIQKVFQNGAGVTASQAGLTMDSLYQVDSLDVRLSEYNQNGNQTNQVHLRKYYNTQKPSGIFASPGQYLYITPTGFVLNGNDNYVLTIYNPKTKITSQATTTVVNDISPRYPNTGAEINLSTDQQNYYPITFGVGNNAATYDVNINIPVRNYRKKDSSLISVDTLVYNVLKSYPISGPMIDNALKGYSFYYFVGGSLTPDKTVYRKMDSLDFEITGAAGDLANYVLVNTPTSGIVQNIPSYTNISNGVGIFSSRNITHIHAPLSTGAYATLITSPLTSALNFVRP